MRAPRSSLLVVASVVAALGLPPSAGAVDWSPGSSAAEVDLDAPVEDAVDDPRVATAPDGTSVAAWYVVDDPSVRVATRTPGPAGWAAAIDLTALVPEDPALGALAGVDDVQVATGRDGTLVVSWWEDHDHGQIVRVAVRRPGASWVVSSPSGTVVGEVDDPFAAVADDGTIAVAWVHADDELRVQRMRTDGWADDAEEVSIEANEPRLGFLPDGALYAAFEDPDAERIVVVEWRDGVRTVRDDVSTADASEPDLAVSRDGRVALVWEEDHAADRSTRALVRSTDGTWSGSWIGLPGRDARLPKVAAGDAGFVAAWDSEGAEDRVDAAVLGAGTSWSPTEAVTGTLPGDGESDVAVTPDGSASVVYEDLDAGLGVVRARTRPAGGPWGPQEVVATSVSGQKSGPQVAAYADGSFAAIWRTISPGPREAVQAGFLDRAGPVIEAAPPATATIGVPLELSATVLDHLSDVEAVSWEVQDGPTSDGAALTWTPGALGDRTLTVRARDARGNESTRTFVVRVVPAPREEPPVTGGPGPAPDPTPDARDAPAPDAPPACAAPYVELVGIRATGTARVPRVRLTGVTGPALVGRTVEIRRDGRRIGSARVGADRSVVATVAAPRSARSRARARYRLVIGTVRSRALKASREATISGTKRLAGGRVAVAGRIAGVRRATTLTITGTPVCGDARRTRTTVRTDRSGRFRVTLGPVGGAGSAAIFRIAPRGGVTVTLPVVVTAR